MNIKILVCCHKNEFWVSNDVYYPIHVGKQNHTNVDLGIPGDNEGDNISNKNNNYCELTGMYWAWKNMTGVDAIGLCHYRRYFDFEDKSIFKNQINHISVKEIKENTFRIPKSLSTSLTKNIIVLPKKRVSPYSLKLSYCLIHSCEDLRILEDLIKRTQPQKYIAAYERIMRFNNKLSAYNMFIMKWNVFDEYCKWLFDLLFAYEKCVDITNYTDYQKRIFGFISERLLNVFVEANNLQVTERPVLIVDEENRKPLAGFIYCVHSFLNNLIFKLHKIINGKSM